MYNTMAKQTSVRHIGIIMDGNGRWAKQHQLPRAAGHAKGAEVFRTITRHCEKLGIEALTVYAFSTENWSRSEEEVNAIMDLLRRYLKDAFGFKGESIRVRFIGRRDRLAADLLENMQKIEQSSADNTGLTLNVALDYGGRDEIVHAARMLAEKAAAGELAPCDIDEAMFDGATFTAQCPPVDFILRPSGEQRISNFLLWQCAYSEFIYMDTLWPDFTPAHLDEAIALFEGRNRRFGGR